VSFGAAEHIGARPAAAAMSPMFEFIECPACGSDDTTSIPYADGVQELQCSACGTITSLEMALSPL
jgi:hypothetical protein